MPIHSFIRNEPQFIISCQGPCSFETAQDYLTALKANCGLALLMPGSLSRVGPPHARPARGKIACFPRRKQAAPRKFASRCPISGFPMSRYTCVELSPAPLRSLMTRSSTSRRGFALSAFRRATAAWACAPSIMFRRLVVLAGDADTRWPTELPPQTACPDPLSSARTSPHRP